MSKEMEILLMELANSSVTTPSDLLLLEFVKIDTILLILYERVGASFGDVDTISMFLRHDFQAQFAL